MELILWRHAESEDGTPDLTRELTAKGLKQAEKSASFLRQHMPEDTRILVSPATRTLQTIAALTDHFTLAPTIAPGASAHTVLQTARWPDAGGSVLVVGHQPTLGDVAAQLLGCNLSPPSIKKGALWWFTLRKRNNSSQILLRVVITPEFL